MSEAPTITAEFTHDTFRRGAVPSPDGVLPIRRRNRRGMVRLDEWDRKVEQDNQARGTASLSKQPDLADLLKPEAPAEPEAIGYPAPGHPGAGEPDAGQKEFIPPPPGPAAGEPTEPADDPDDGKATTRGAILEPPDSPPPPKAANPTSPPGDIPRDTIPPPKAATKTTRRRTATKVATKAAQQAATTKPE